jgi:hypothetical protein
MGAKRDKTSVNVPLQGGMCMPYEQPLRWNKSEPREVNSAGSQKFMLRESLPVTRADGIAARKPKDRIS